MDLDEDEADRLFGDDRSSDLDEADLSYYIKIALRDDGVLIETDDEAYRLDDDQVESMVDDLGWDSIWRAVSEKTKCLRYLREHDGV